MNYKLALFDPRLVRRRHTFSLTSQLRAMILIGLAFGWYSALPIVPPPILAFVILGVAAPLAIIVGYCRRGPTLARVVAVMCFFGSGCMVSLWTAFVAVVIQQTPASMKEGFGEFLALLTVIASLPCVVFMLFFMFRAWSGRQTTDAARTGDQFQETEKPPAIQCKSLAA